MQYSPCGLVKFALLLNSPHSAYSSVSPELSAHLLRILRLLRGKAAAHISSSQGAQVTEAGFTQLHVSPTHHWEPWWLSLLEASLGHHPFQVSGASAAQSVWDLPSPIQADPGTSIWPCCCVLRHVTHTVYYQLSSRRQSS